MDENIMTLQPHLDNKSAILLSAAVWSTSRVLAVIWSMKKRILLLLLICAAASVAVWAVVHFRAAKRNRLSEPANNLSNLTKSTSADSWAEAVEKVKANRGEQGNAPLVIPPELKHYSDRHWFLATQVAEIDKN